MSVTEWGGHREDSRSQNVALYQEFLHYMANDGDELLRHYPKTAPKNATSLSKTSQNEMTNIIGFAVRNEVVR